jgi:hypothetical protein
MENYNMREDKIAEKYLSLVRKFTSGDQTASEFSTEYMSEFLDEQAGLSDDLFWILQNLFAEAEAYCEDPALRDEDDNDEQELLTAARAGENDLERWLDGNHD